MSWTWSYDTEAEGLPHESFGSQSEAESWVGETWRELLDAGVHTVTLMNDGASVYAMSLEAAD